MESIAIVIAGGLAFMVAERIFPDQTLDNVPTWWTRVIVINALQASLVILAGYLWDPWLRSFQLMDLGSLFSPVTGAMITYGFHTFFYYWWHRWRHTNHSLWLALHQLHHSPARIEAITSFYKHPLEIVTNSIIVSAITYSLFGLTIEGAGALTVITAFAEFFYHMNIRTPQWLGWFIQRPEMHRIHHQRGRHFNNFGDLPVWDLIYGTYENPKTYQGKCGFKENREQRFIDIFLGKNVNSPLKVEITQ